MRGVFARTRRNGDLKRLAIGAAVLGSSLAVAVPAASAKVTSVTHCQDIDSPGKYRLDADVTASFTRSCFSINSSGVTLNLNGHTITNGATAGFGIVVNGSGANIVGPGTISNFTTSGISLTGGSSSGNASVRGVTATGSDHGIDLVNSPGNTIKGNVTTDNGRGIEVDSGDNTIIGNYAHGNSFDDLIDNNANCDSNVWRGNDFGTANQSCIH